MKILVINPGSTSTKLAVYEEETPIYTASIAHSAEDLAAFDGVADQLDYRLAMIRDNLAQAGYTIKDFDAVSARGGYTRPVKAGTFLINEIAYEEIAHRARREHAANLGILLSWELTKGTGVPAYFVDPVSVDELTDVGRVTGFCGMEREGFFHALNHRGMARKAAAMLGKTYEDCNFVVAHLGGGITVAAHQHGRAIEANCVFDEGCFSMDRGGSLPVRQVVELCFSGRTKADILRQIDTGAGVVSYLNTRDFRDVERMAFEEGRADAKRIYDALVYQLSRDIGSMATVLKFDVDAIILTGGMAYSKRLTSAVEDYVGKIAPLMILPGEVEMLSLAQGALRVLKGEEQAQILL